MLQLKKSITRTGNVLVTYSSIFEGGGTVVTGDEGEMPSSPLVATSSQLVSICLSRGRGHQ
jgi:hypothetical protein